MTKYGMYRATSFFASAVCEVSRAVEVGFETVETAGSQRVVRRRVNAAAEAGVRGGSVGLG